MVQIDFNSQQYEPDVGFQPIPGGLYQAHITNSDKREAKSGNGWYLWFEFEVREGPHKGRKLFTNFNLGNSNAEAVRIANGQFSALCRACGKLGRVSDTQQLHMIPVEIKVTERPAKDGFDASNDIRGYRPLAVSAAAAPPPPAGQPQPQSGEAPWGRK